MAAAAVSGWWKTCFERQMAAQFFPVQSFRNMGRPHRDAPPGGGQGRAGFERNHPRSRQPARAHPGAGLSHRGGRKSLAYASDAGYGTDGPPQAAVDLYRGVDLLIHDSTFTPEDRALRLGKGPVVSRRCGGLCRARRGEKTGAFPL